MLTQADLIRKLLVKNLDLLFEWIESVKFDRGYIIKDNFFPKNLALNLRDLALSNNFSYDKNHPAGYLARDFDNGNRSQLSMRSIANEYITPKLHTLTGRTYIRSWSFTYNNICPGVAPHADPSLVNINVWVTPNDAIADRSKNGLIIYRKKAPKDWTHYEYNTYTEKISNFLKDAKYVRIPYKFNRAVIFPGNTFHATDSVHTKPGVENQRVNYTFLYR